MGGFSWILLLIYGGVAWRFWQGFSKTHFNSKLGSRLKLALLWPVFLAISSNYRQNFRRALKGD
jgi:hypothetical protein